MKRLLALCMLACSTSLAAQAIALRDIDKGEVLTPQNIGPGAPNSSVAEMLGRQTIRRIQKGKRLTHYALQPEWVVQHGAPTEVLLTMDQLEIRLNAIGASNSLAGESAKARWRGKLLEGLATADGQILIRKQ